MHLGSCPRARGCVDGTPWTLHGATGLVGHQLSPGQMTFVVSMKKPTTVRVFVAASLLLALAGTESMGVTIRALIVRGTVEVRNKDVTVFGRLRQGEIIALGATIRTGPKGRAQLTPLPGVVSAIGPGSEVVIAKAEQSVRADGTVETQRGILALRKGTVTTTIDRSHSKATDYGIATPRGVASARGTVFTVSYDGRVQSVTVLDGSVTLTTPTGTTTVNQGSVSVNGVIGGQEFSFTSTAANLYQAAKTEGLSDANAAALVAETVSDLSDALSALATLAKIQPDAVTAEVLNDVAAALTALKESAPASSNEGPPPRRPFIPAPVDVADESPAGL